MTLLRRVIALSYHAVGSGLLPWAGVESYS